MSKEQVQEFVDAMLNHRYDDMSDLIKEGFDINVPHEFPMGCVRRFKTKIFFFKNIFQDVRRNKKVLYL